MDKTMSVEEILDLITQPKPMSRTVTITLYEGGHHRGFCRSAGRPRRAYLRRGIS